jgi:hypothetical protein
VGFPTVGTVAYRLIVPPCFWVSLVSARRAPHTDVARGFWQRKGELWARNGGVNLAYNCKDFLHAATSCDMGPTALLPLRRKASWGFFRPKNLTASAGFEPANLGTRGQRANH